MPLVLEVPAGVRMIRGPDGRPGGEAFVRIADHIALQQALQYDRRLLGRRYIEVMGSSEDELREALARQGNVDVSSGVLRLRGVPFDAGKREICDFLRGYGITPEAVSLHEVGGRHTGEAWVRFPGGETAARDALEHCQNQRIGSRYIELFPARGTGDQETPAVTPQQSVQLVPGRGYLRVRGMPFQAQALDLARFFDGYGVLPENVQLRLTASGRSTGEGMVQFPTQEAAKRAAASLNKHFLFGRYLELFPMTDEEVQAFLAQRVEPPLIANFPTLPGAAYLRLRGVPQTCSQKEIVDFLKDVENVQEEQVAFGRTPEGKPNGEAWVQVQHLELAQDIIGKRSNCDMGGRTITISQAMEHEARTMGSGITHRPVGTTWVKMRGLPFSAMAEDLVQFFSDFKLAASKCVMGRSADGRASGEAWVQFDTEETASRAIQSKDRGHIGGRYVELFPATTHEVARVVEQQKNNPGSALGLPPGTLYMKLRGIPFSSLAQDIVDFLTGFDVTPEDVTLGKTADGRPSGDAWVRFKDDRTAAAAMQSKNRASLGGRYIEFFPSSEMEAQRASSGVGGYGPDAARAAASAAARANPYGMAGCAAGCAAGCGAAAQMPGFGFGVPGYGLPLMSAYGYGFGAMGYDAATAAQYQAAYGMGQYGAAAAQYGMQSLMPMQYSTMQFGGMAAQYPAVAAQAASTQPIQTMDPATEPAPATSAS